MHEQPEGRVRSRSEAPAMGRGGRCLVLRRAGRVGHRRANMSAVLPLSADKPRPLAGPDALLSRQTFRPTQANMSAGDCPYPRISRGPLAGPRFYPEQTFRPAQANRSKVMHPRISDPVPEQMREQSESARQGAGRALPGVPPGGTGWPPPQANRSEVLALIRG